MYRVLDLRNFVKIAIRNLAISYYNKFIGGAPRFAGYEIRRRRKSEPACRQTGAGKNSLPAGRQASPQPPSFLPARAKIIKSQCQDFRGKKFGFRSRQTAI